MYQKHSKRLKQSPNKKNTQYTQKQAIQPSYLAEDYDQQVSSILFSESQYSNKKPSRNKVYYTPEKKYDNISAKRQQQKQNQLNAQSNRIFSFSSHQAGDSNNQTMGDYIWNIPQRQNTNQFSSTSKKNKSNSFHYQQQQQDQISHSDEQNSYIPSDISSNLFESSKSFSQSLNKGNPNVQQQLQNLRDFNNNIQNYRGNMGKLPEQQFSRQSLNKGFTQDYSEGQEDSTELIIQNMRSDLLQVDPQMQQIKPNTNVHLISNILNQDYENRLYDDSFNKPQIYSKQNDKGYLYSQSQPISPSDQQPIDFYDKSKRDSFCYVNNSQQQTNQIQCQSQRTQQQKKQSQNQNKKKLNSQNNSEYHQSYENDENYFEIEERNSVKKKNDDPIVRDIIDNIQSSKKYLSHKYNEEYQQKNCKKQLYIYESILDENKYNIPQKQFYEIGNTQNISNSLLNSKQKKQPYNSIEMLDSIQKKRSISLQNNSIHHEKRQSNSCDQYRQHLSINYSSQSPRSKTDNKPTIESKLSHLKDLTFRHISAMPLSSHLSSKKINPINSPHQRSGFQVCQYLKDSSMKQIRPIQNEKIFYEQNSQEVKSPREKVYKLKQEISTAQVKQNKETDQSNLLNSQILKLDQDQKQLGEQILLTDQKVNRLEIKNKKLKSKWRDLGISQQQINDQELYINQMNFNNFQLIQSGSQEQKNSYIIQELNRCNNDMQNQLELVLKQIESEKQRKQNGKSINKSQQQDEEDKPITKIKTLDNVTSPNNTLSLPSSPYSFIGGSYSAKNQIQSNKYAKTQFTQFSKSDDSLNNIMGNYFDSQDQMISHLIQKYSPTSQKSNTPSSNNTQYTQNSIQIQQPENNKLTQSLTQSRQIQQERALHDIMEESSCDDSKASFLPLTHYKKK